MKKNVKPNKQRKPWESIIAAFPLPFEINKTDSRLPRMWSVQYYSSAVYLGSLQRGKFEAFP